MSVGDASRTIHVLGRVWQDPWDGLRDHPSLLRRELDQENQAASDALSSMTDTVARLAARHPAWQLLASELPPAQALGDFWYLPVVDDKATVPRIVRTPRSDPMPTPGDIKSGMPHDTALDLPRLIGKQALGSVAFSVDGSLAAWTSDSSGAERFTLNIIEVSSGQVLVPPVDGCGPGIWLAPDGRSAYWMELDALQRPWRLMHLDIDTHDREPVLEEMDQTRRLRARLAADNSHMVISSVARGTSNHWILPLKPGGMVTPVPPPVGSHLATVDVGCLGGKPAIFSLVSNDSHPGDRLMVRPIDSLGGWILLYDAGEDTQLTPPLLLRDHVVLGCKDHSGDSRLLVRSTHRNSVWRQLPADPHATLAVAQTPPWDGSRLTVSVTSYVQPPTMGHIELSSTELDVQLPYAVGGPYSVEEMHVAAGDGVQIPVTVLSRPDRLDGPAPCVITAYGAYGVSQRPSYNPVITSMLDAGMVYAVAHVRGGGEGGRDWHTAATGLRKKTTFTDFIAVVEYLVANGVADRRRIGAHGGSAGGLLIGAVLNMQPDLLAVAAASVPFVDPVTTMLHPELPLTISDRPEWGDPLTDPETLDYMLSYSPIHNIIKGRTYPPILVTAGLDDSRVSPLEAFKWVRALRRDASGGPFVLRIRDGGHVGGADIAESIGAILTEFTWLASHLGVELAPPG
ncbi:prolyl oligopeptidase family serine peptidase [Luteococcus sp.]|uniref:prolyl oligopeptidase family serine peptidase n=1 Tax=Luteococcus sp. TaxID=1969402 RepID=UPI0037369B37